MGNQELSLFDNVEQNLMTTKELAETLKVAEKTIRRTAEKLRIDSTVHPFKTNGGVQNIVCYTEQQATAIKQEIQKHHNLASRQIDTVDVPSLFGDTANRDSQQYMTTKEVADTLGVSNMAIMRVLEKTNNLNGTVKVENGKTTVFTQAQATLIKQEIQKHHNLASRQIDTVTTEQEENDKILEVISILQRRANEYRQRAEVAEDVVNRISDSRGLYSVNQAAKALQLGYGNVTLYKKLVGMKVVMSDKSHTPYQQCVNDGYLVVKTKYISTIDKSVPVTLIINKGLVWLAKKFGTTIDRNIEADA